jgi:hypothetical protein
MGDRSVLDELFRAISEDLAAGRISVKFWLCPAGHSDRRAGEPFPDGLTVVWDGDVARCTEPGCGRTSADRGDADAVASNRPDPASAGPPIEGEVG